MIHARTVCATTTFIACLLLARGAGAAESAAAEVNNGTDPTKIARTAYVSWEHLDLIAGDQATAKASFETPVGDGRTGIRLQVPLVRNTALGYDGYGAGDLALRVNRVARFTPTYGVVVSGELFLDTASKTEHGAGQHFFKGTVIYAKFLEGGAIFAPALVHSMNIQARDSRADISTTVLDFYYVPKFSDPRMVMTVDPAVNRNWESDATFFSLAVTVGRMIGPAFGGNGQFYVKPSTALGSERPFDWGVEVGFKVIGF